MNMSMLSRVDYSHIYAMKVGISPIGLRYFEQDTSSICIEDPNTSCKSKPNSVKCLKIKKGKHFKPFYNSTERW